MRVVYCAIMVSMFITGCGSQGITFQMIEKMPWGTIGKPENWIVTVKEASNITLESLEEQNLKVEAREVPNQIDKESYATEQAKLTGRKLIKSFKMLLAGSEKQVYETRSIVGKKTVIEKMFFIDSSKNERIAIVWAYPDGSKQSWQAEGIVKSVMVR